MSRSHPAKQVEARPSHGSLVLGLLVREHVLGTMVYVCSVAERSGNALLGLAVLIAAVLWSCLDGVLPPLRSCRLCMAVLESALLYVGAVAVANVLRLTFGHPPGL